MHRKPKATVYVEFNFHTKNRNFSEQTKKVVPSQNFLKTQKQNRKFLPLPWRQTTLLPSSLLRLGGAPLAFPPALSPAPPRCGGVGVARRCFSWTSRGTATEAKSRARSLRPSCGSLRWPGSTALTRFLPGNGGEAVRGRSPHALLRSAAVAGRAGSPPGLFDTTMEATACLGGPSPVFPPICS